MPWSDLQKKFVEANLETTKACIQWVEDTLRASLESGQTEQGLSSNRLARIILFYAITCSDIAKRSSARKTVSTNVPKWKDVAQEANNFSAGVANEISSVFCEEFGDDNIGQFATLAGRKRGVQKKYYYSTLLFFVMQLQETGRLSDDLFGRFASKDDKGFIANALRVISNTFDEGLPTMAAEPHREVRVRINVKEANFKKYQDFHQRFDLGNATKSESHFIVYRTMRSNPTSVMKSFLAISEPSGIYQDKDAYAFSHIYVPPNATGEKRFSGGKLLPLDDGVYLVGGQRPYSRARRGVPFSSIKVLAFRWHDLERGHKLFPALTLSTNYRGVPIVSRAAVRVTPISHSSKLKLGKIDLGHILDDLRADLEVERQFINERGLDDSAKSIEMDIFLAGMGDEGIVDFSKELIKVVNNGPGQGERWDAPVDFSKQVKQGQKLQSQRLTKDALRSAVSEAMQTGMAADEYKDADGTPFDFWRHLRFGPIEIE
jgi:hypothetical protein